MERSSASITRRPRTARSSACSTAKVSTSAARLPSKPNFLLQLFLSSFPVLLLVAIFIYFMRQMQGAAGGRGAMSFGKSRARLLGEDQVSVTFADVAGVDEAKEEVVEIVDFLKDPGKFQKLGGKIPKGVLMVGCAGHRQDAAGPCDRRAKPRCRSSPSPAPISWKCSWASARRVCATCSSKPRSTLLASFSSTRSMPSAGIAARAWVAAMTSASRRSTSCWSRWMASKATKASSSSRPPIGRTCWTRRCCVLAASIARSWCRCRTCADASRS